MSSSLTPSQVRRQVTTIEGFTTLAPAGEEAAKAIADLRAAIALKRTLRFVDRRVAKTDRRLISDRRAMVDVLNEAFVKSQQRRFTSEPMTGFGALGAM